MYKYIHLHYIPVGSPSRGGALNYILFSVPGIVGTSRVMSVAPFVRKLNSLIQRCYHTLLPWSRQCHPSRHSLELFAFLMHAYKWLKDNGSNSNHTMFLSAQSYPINRIHFLLD